MTAMSFMRRRRRRRRQRARAAAPAGRLQAEHRRHVRVAEVRRLGANHDLAAADRPQRHLVQRRAARALAARDPRLEALACLDGGRLAERAGLREQSRAAGGDGGLQQPAPRQWFVVAHFAPYPEISAWSHLRARAAHRKARTDTEPTASRASGHRA